MCTIWDMGVIVFPFMCVLCSSAKQEKHFVSCQGYSCVRTQGRAHLPVAGVVFLEGVDSLGSEATHSDVGAVSAKPQSTSP